MHYDVLVSRLIMIFEFADSQMKRREGGGGAFHACSRRLNTFPKILGGA